MKHSIVLVAVALLAFMGPSAAFADDTECSDDVLTGTYDNVKVVKGKSCTIDGATVAGNVQADEASFVDVRGGSEVGGDVTIKKSTGLARCRNSKVGGNFQAEENLNGIAFRCDVSGDVQLFKNGPSRAFENTIGGNLQCKENASYPGNQGGNDVAGDKEDGCAGF